MIRQNVQDRRLDWIGPREALGQIGLDIAALQETDEGRDVIYHAHHGKLDAGRISSWNERYVFVRFHNGDTAAAVDPSQLEFCAWNVWNLVPNRYLERSFATARGKWGATGTVSGTGVTLTIYADTLTELHTLALGRAYPLKIAKVWRVP